ncbi:MAG: DUF4268 domain-containing protein [Chloroflexi bacterium]|nr:DUF4268 domain-containing protein [Chloroflexota bacterium]
MPKLGRLQRVDAKDVWKHEAHDFTPWLHTNIGLLGEALGFDIEATASEVAVGDFAVDIVGKTVPDGRIVVVENQLAPTDHGHLGQVLTYASGLDAAIVVWLSPRFRDEHRRALDWLNEHTTEGIDFFGVELELLRIDDSDPAPHLKLVAQPNEWAKTARGTSGAQPTGRGLTYQRFFEAVLAEFKRLRPGLTSVSRVVPGNYIGMAVGRTGFSLSWVFGTQGRFRVELYVDTGTRDENKAFFDALYAQRETLEGVLGGGLVWERLDTKRACRVYVQRDVPSAPAPDENFDLRSWAVETMVRWNDVLRPTIRSLAVPASPPMDLGVGSGS